MNLPFFIAGLLALVGAAIHGGVGEAIVVSKLQTETLFPTRFGGPWMTKLMIRATWHITTLAFLVLGAGMLACVPADGSEACRGVGKVAAVAFGAFLLLTAGLSARAIRRRQLRHPAPLVFAAVAILAWWGSTSP